MANKLAFVTSTVYWSAPFIENACAYEIYQRYMELMAKNPPFIVKDVDIGEIGLYPGKIIYVEDTDAKR